jgi:hypothetical protein
MNVAMVINTRKKSGVMILRRSCLRACVRACAEPHDETIVRCARPAEAAGGGPQRYSAVALPMRTRRWRITQPVCTM